VLPGPEVDPGGPVGQLGQQCPESIRGLAPFGQSIDEQTISVQGFGPVVSVELPVPWVQVVVWPVGGVGQVGFGVVWPIVVDVLPSVVDVGPLVPSVVDEPCGLVDSVL